MTTVVGSHAGHERLHDILVLVSILFMIFTQIGLYIWKKHRPASFRKITLLGMWLIPCVGSLYFGFWRMLSTWTIYTIMTAVLIKHAKQKPLQHETPRRVYMFIFVVYRITYFAALIGYSMLMLEIFGVSAWINENILADDSAFAFKLGPLGLLLLFYGMYYGVLNRDISEMITDKLASTMGFSKKHGEMPSRRFDPDICLICSRPLKLESEKPCTLENCSHTFHDFCIRGWTIIGKKDTCPYCSEKVSLKASFTNPWESQGILWSQLLDAVRYLIVWNPCILLCIDVLFYFVDVPDVINT